MTKKTSNKLEVATGLAAIAAAAAGAYYFFGNKKAAQHRKTAKAWMDTAKKEVVKELGSLQKVSKTNYEKTISQVMKKYQALKETTPAETAKLVKDLKAQWKNIEKHVKQNLPKAKKTVIKKKK